MRIERKSLIVALGAAMSLTLVSAAMAAGVEADSKVGSANSSSNNAAVLRAQILARWQPVAEAAGADYGAWANVFGTQLDLMSASELKRLDALKIGSASSAKGDYEKFTQAFMNSTANRVMNPEPGKTTLKLGSTTDDQVFIPITPCRVVDTRVSSGGSGPISASTQRAFFFYNASSTWSWATTSGSASGAQGGAPGVAATVCPGTTLTAAGGTLGAAVPSAAVATVTVVSPTGAGNLVVWGGAGSAPQASAVNFATGQNLANTTVIPAGGRTGPPVFDFTVRYNGPSGAADVVVDVVGYFVENHATALQCVYLNSSGVGTGNFPTGSHLTISNPACTTGYTKTASGCNTDIFLANNIYLYENSPQRFNDCVWQNNSGATQDQAVFNTETVCCRVPGQ